MNRASPSTMMLRHVAAAQGPPLGDRERPRTNGPLGRGAPVAFGQLTKAEAEFRRVAYSEVGVIAAPEAVEPPT